MKMATRVACALLLGVGLGTAHGGSSPQIKGLDQLQASDGVFDITLINPDADFTKYDKIVQSDLVLKFRGRTTVAASADTGTNLKRRKTVGPSKAEQDMERFEKILEEELAAELARSESYQLVDRSGPNTLIVRSAVVDVVSKIKPSGRDIKPGKLVAEGTIVFDLIDAESGEIQARLGAHREARRSPMASSGDEANGAWSDVATWAQRAANDLMQQLEQLQDSQARRAG